MKFLGCDGNWTLQADGSTVCQGELKTFTAQEMRDIVRPSMTVQDKVELAGGLIGLFALVWAGRKLVAIWP